MNIPHISIGLKALCSIACFVLNMHIASGRDIKKIYGVTMAPDLSELLANAIIPYADAFLDVSNESSDVNSALFVSRFSDEDKRYYEYFLPDGYQTKEYSDSIYMITLTNTRHLKNCPLWWFDPRYYAVINGTKVFVADNARDIVVNRVPTLPTIRLNGPGRMYDYDPQLVAAFKVNGAYKFYVSPSYLELFENEYNRKYNHNSTFCDSATLKVMELGSDFTPLLNRYSNKSMMYLIDRIDSQRIRITMMPKRWATVSDKDDYYLIATPGVSEQSAENYPYILVRKSLSSKIGMLTDKCATVSVPCTIPEFVPYMEFPAFEYLLNMPHQ